MDRSPALPLIAASRLIRLGVVGQKVALLEQTDRFHPVGVAVEMRRARASDAACLMVGVSRVPVHFLAEAAMGYELPGWAAEMREIFRSGTTSPS